jgi:hypothetical protein
MRRRRSPLKPDNFPFLAVLLCAMGSLILLLLVMDRRAKAVARAKALQTLARQAEDEARALAAAERAAAERRADWERRRQQRHALLEQQEHETRGQIATVQQRLRLVTQQEQGEEAGNQTLQKRLLQLRGALSQSEGALAAARGKVAAAARQADQSQGELAELTRQVESLELILKETKEAREREQRTFSLVPYHGKRGDSRRPVYVECTADGVIFHPEKVPLQGFGFVPSAFRAEVERRVARLAAQAGEGKKKPEGGAYLLFLIRPDGIDNYYRAVHALAGLDFDFGYEFIDPDWVLDFPTEGAPARQPWMLADKPEPPPAGAAGPTSPAHAAPRGMPWPGATPRGVAFGKNGSGSGIEAEGGSGGPPAGRLGPIEPGTATASGRGIVGGNPGSAPGPWLPGAPGPGGPGLSGPGGAGFGPGGATAGSGPLARAGGGVVGGLPATGSRQGPGPGVPGAIFDGPGGTAGPGRAGNGSGNGTGGGSGNNTRQAAQPAAPPTPAGSAATSPPDGLAAGSRQGAKGTDTGQGGTPGNGASGVSGGGSGGAPERAPGDTQGDVPAGSRAAGIRWGGGGSSGEAGDAGGSGLLPGVVPSLSSARPSKRPPSPPLRLVGNRDWILRVECLADAVVLYPSSRRFPTATLAPNQDGRKELVQAVQQMIARRQATVRPGELPYRPQIRFLVRPEGVRTFFQVYPVLEAVGVPMNRQDVEQDEDVR